MQAINNGYIAQREYFSQSVESSLYGRPKSKNLNCFLNLNFAYDKPSNFGRFISHHDVKKSPPRYSAGYPGML